MSGEKNHVHAAVYGPDDSERKHPIYEVDGAWNRTFTFKDVLEKKDLEIFDTNAQKPAPLKVAPVEEQDPWESRRAWAGVIDALEHGDMQRTSDAKSKVEQAQREWRRKEEAESRPWQPKFFIRSHTDDVFERLASASSAGQHRDDAAYGIWKFNAEEAARAQRPFHGNARPDVA